MASVMESLRAGAEDYLIKPLDIDAVIWCVERAVARRAAKAEQNRLHEALVSSNIRERQHATAEARQRAQLNALLENLNEGVCVADPNGDIVMVNDAARAILGIENGALRTVDALHSLEACDLEGRPLDTDRRPLMRAFRGEQFTNYEVLSVRPDGTRRRITSTGTSVEMRPARSAWQSSHSVTSRS